MDGPSFGDADAKQVMACGNIRAKTKKRAVCSMRAHRTRVRRKEVDKNHFAGLRQA